MTHPTTILTPVVRYHLAAGGVAVMMIMNEQ